MTVKELIAELSQQPQDANLMVAIGNPKVNAFTDDITVLKYDPDENSVTIDGWVASDNPNAHMPGYGDD